MQLSFLLLLLLSGGILGFRANRCGRDVSTMKKYLGIGVDVSIDKLADVLLGPNPFPIRYADVFIGTKYESFVDVCHNFSSTTWTDIGDYWLARNVNYIRKIDDNPIFDFVPIVEEQKTLYEERRLIVTKKVLSQDLPEFFVFVEYCITPGTAQESDIEVDISMNFTHYAIGNLSDFIRNASDEGFLRNYEAFQFLLQKLEDFYDLDPVQLKIKPISIENIIQLSTTPVISITTLHPLNTTLIDGPLFAGQPLYFGLLILVCIVLIGFIWWLGTYRIKKASHEKYKPNSPSVSVVRDPEGALEGIELQ